MGDTDLHTIAILCWRLCLEAFFAKRADVYVASNLIFYYEEGNRRARRDPDILVAKGAEKRTRRTYLLWREGVLPCMFGEVVSRKTARVDLEKKRALYARLNVPEYIVFDPEGKYVKEQLQGFRSVSGESVPMKRKRDGSIVSKELGLRMIPEGGMLRLYNAVTDEKILTPMERAETERQRSAELAAEVERLRAELAKRERSRRG